jgi:hypothetical protein
MTPSLIKLSVLHKVVDHCIDVIASTVSDNFNTVELNDDASLFERANQIANRPKRMHDPMLEKRIIQYKTIERMHRNGITPFDESDLAYFARRLVKEYDLYHQTR